MVGQEGFHFSFFGIFDLVAGERKTDEDRQDKDARCPLRDKKPPAGSLLPAGGRGDHAKLACCCLPRKRPRRPCLPKEQSNAAG